MRAIVMAAAVTLAAGGASAATMTFDGIEAPVSQYSENGITASGNAQIFPSGLPGTAHLDDAGTPFASELLFTMDGIFDAIGFDIYPTDSLGQKCQVVPPDGQAVCEPYPFEDVRVSGYLGGSLVAEDAFDMFTVDGSYTFGSDFQGIDALLIGFAPLPGPDEFEDGSFFECKDVAPCVHYSIDNVVLEPIAPVPLPASMWLLGAALTGLGLARRRT